MITLFNQRIPILKLNPCNPSNTKPTLPLTTLSASKPKPQAFVALKHADELRDIIRLPEFNRDTVLWLGGGSNILLMEDYAGLVVHMENKGIREIERSDGLVYIEAQAGEIWHDFVLHTVGLGLSGLENLSLIPGTVGASPVQNIGAYGVEAKDVIHSVRCFDLDTEPLSSFPMPTVTLPIVKACSNRKARGVM